MEIGPLVKEDFIVIDDEATLSEMIGALKQFEKRSCLVFRNQKYLGLVEKKRLLRSRLDATKTKVGSYVQETPLLKEDADVLDTAYLMYQSNQYFLPVEKNKQIIGVLEGLDLANLAADLPEIKKLKVKDFKLLKPAKVNKGDPIASVIDLMQEESLDQVPIFENGRLSGIISYRDVLRKYLNWSPKRDVSAKFNKLASSKSAEVDMPHLASLPVSSFSTNENLVSTSSTQNIKSALSLMTGNRVSSLPVLDLGEFKGLLTVKNVLRCVASLKIPQEFNIQFVGLKELKLTEHQNMRLQEICSNEAFKLQRLVHNQFELIVHIKEYEKDGKQHKFSVNLRVEFPGKIVTVSQEDWVLETALHKAFDNAKNSLGSKFKGRRGKGSPPSG